MTSQDVYREYYTLTMFDHPFVIPVLGIFVDPNDSLPAMVSMYMCNGTICAYLERNPDANRLCLVRISISGRLLIPVLIGLYTAG